MSLMTPLRVLLLLVVLGSVLVSACGRDAGHKVRIGSQILTLSDDALSEKFRSGECGDTTLVFHGHNWVLAANVPATAALLAQVRAERPPTPPVAAPAAAPPAGVAAAASGAASAQELTARFRNAVQNRDEAEICRLFRTDGDPRIEQQRSDLIQSLRENPLNVSDAKIDTDERGAGMDHYINDDLEARRYGILHLWMPERDGMIRIRHFEVCEIMRKADGTIRFFITAET